MASISLYSFVMPQHIPKTIVLFLFIAVATQGAFAKTFGGDSRLLPSSLLTASEAFNFSGVGQIECTAEADQVYAYTAFLAGAADTVVTVAHAFDYKVTDSDGNTSSRREKHDLEKCWFALYSRGVQVDRVPIKFVISRWDDPKFYDDPSQDVAVVKLLRVPKVAATVPGLSISKVNDLTLIAYHGDIDKGLVLHKTKGMSYAIPERDFAMVTLAARSNIPVSNLENVFISDYDSDKNASGGPIYDRISKTIVGIHMGSYSTVDGGPVFNPRNNFNFGIYFDREILDFISSVARRK